MDLAISSEDFRLFKKFQPIYRLPVAGVLIVFGFILQLLLPIGGIQPYEMRQLSASFIIPFLLGFLLIVIGLALLFPEQTVLS